MISNNSKNIEIREAENKNSSSPKRIATLDFQRGIAIFIMVFIHSAANIIDHSYIENDPSIISEMPIYIIAIFAFLAFFGIWNSYFLLISVTVNSYAMTQGIKNGKDPQRILVKQILTGIGLLIVNIIHNSFFAKGYFGSALRTGDWTNTYPLWNGFFCMGTLRIIGLSMIINSILLYFLLRKNGYEKFTRNIIILGILAIFVIVSTEFVNSWVDNLDWIIPENLPPGVELGENVGWPNNHIQALNASFKSWFCTIISGNTEPLFPFLGTAFIGAILGICLAQPEKIKHLNLIGGLTGLFFLISGIGFVFLGYFSFGNSRPPIGNYLVMLGGQLCVFFILLRLVEYRGKAQEFGNHPLVKHFRLWGMLSLTLFVLDLLDILPRMLFGLGYNVIFSVQLNMIPGNVFGMGQEYLAIIYAIFSIIFYEGIIYLWSRIDFFLSFEWIIIHFVGVITNKFSKRLDVQKMMNEVTWINYDKVSKYDTGEKNLAVKS